MRILLHVVFFPYYFIKYLIAFTALLFFYFKWRRLREKKRIELSGSVGYDVAQFWIDKYPKNFSEFCQYFALSKSGSRG